MNHNNQLTHVESQEIHKRTQSAHCVVQALGQRGINNNVFGKNKLVLKKIHVKNHLLKISSKK